MDNGSEYLQRDADGLVRLPDQFYRVPGNAHITLPTKDVTALLLKNNGRVMACGDLWDIKSKKVGPGVYRIWLERWDYRDRHSSKKS